MSASPGDAVLRYVRTRFPVRLYAPLAVFLSVAGLAGARRLGAVDFVVTVALAATLVFQFRLQDDLADCEADRLRHPDRVLATVRSRTAFRAILLLVFGLNSAVIAWQTGLGRRLTVFMVLTGAFGMWYRWRRRLHAGAFVGSHVVLSKYPVFVYLLGGEAGASRAGHLLLAMLVVYLCFCIYEVLHDPDLRVVPRAHPILGAEMTALGAVGSLMAVALLDHGVPAVSLQATLALAGVLALAALFRRYRRTVNLGPWAYGVFVIGFVQLLTFALEGGS